MNNPPRSDGSTPSGGHASHVPNGAAVPTGTDRRFPIVGIGASAGGLEALGLFLANVPLDSGMAFVIVQHLDPDHPGALPELLQRDTVMPVVQVADGAPVEPDCVYVIPPNRELSILQRRLHLFEPATPRGLRLPIDCFLRSLADDAREQAIGVILSGMGSDGTQGARAIKEQAGAVFVQEPESAKFDSMPRSAIAAGLADVIAPAAALPAGIVAFLNHAPLIAKAREESVDQGHGALEKIAILIRNQTGHDFSGYKSSTFRRRIERRMTIHQVDRIDTYVRLLRENPTEIELLFKELLIGVTSFFRDPPAWEALKSGAIQPLLAKVPPDQALRAWIPGCATGEEAFSLAILFLETLAEHRPPSRQRLQIFATDLDSDAIDQARAGSFQENIAVDLSNERLERYFTRTPHGYRVSDTVRESVIFASQNVIKDAPFSRLDLVVCRNLLIYLKPELQKKLLPMFHYSLNPGGYLLLGNAETVGDLTDLFAPVAGKAQLYRRIDTGPGNGPRLFPETFVRAGGRQGRPATRSPLSLQTQAEQLLLTRYTPAAVLVSGNGDILFVSGRTGNYLEPAAGKANWNIFAMARDGLAQALAGAFPKALRQVTAVTCRNVRISSDGRELAVDLTVQALAEPEPLRGLVMLLFNEAARPVAAPEPLPARGPLTGGTEEAAELARELEQAHQELRAAREAMQSSLEEAMSNHEELQSSNEELQSINEELTTSKEEMQSMNEELQTLNHELQAKVEDLFRRNNDLNNLLESTEIGTVFLDATLRVRLFTKGSNRVFKLIQGDLGRPLTDIACHLEYPDLAADACEVLRTLATCDKELPGPGGSWFRARIMPYRTLQQTVDGVVLTFTDITAAKRLEAQLRSTGAELEQRIEDQERPRAAGAAPPPSDDGAA